MKKVISGILLAVSVFILGSCGDYKNEDITITELGIPLYEQYKTDPKSRNVWDMVINDNKLYIGSGDYGKNTGPVSVWSLDLKTEQWKNEATLQEEQINRFVTINGKLTIPGIDPKTSWDKGTYYSLNNGEWEKFESIPGGVHNFDMVEFDGKIFAGVGRERKSPIVCSNDGGKTFVSVKMVRNGKEVEIVGKNLSRVYDFIEHNGKLYAFHEFAEDSDYQKDKKFELYVYEDGKFVFFSDITSYIEYSKNYNVALAKKLVFKENVYIVNDILVMTKDMDNFYRAVLSKKYEKIEIVRDISVINDKLVVLTSIYFEKNKKTPYVNNIYTSTDGYNFINVFKFESPLPAKRFAYNDGTFYIGMGTVEHTDESFNTDYVGEILKINKEIN